MTASVTIILLLLASCGFQKTCVIVGVGGSNVRVEFVSHDLGLELKLMSAFFLGVKSGCSFRLSSGVGILQSTEKCCLCSIGCLSIGIRNVRIGDAFQLSGFRISSSPVLNGGEALQSGRSKRMVILSSGLSIPKNGSLRSSDSGVGGGMSRLNSGLRKVQACGSVQRVLAECRGFRHKLLNVSCCGLGSNVGRSFSGEETVVSSLYLSDTNLDDVLRVSIVLAASLVSLHVFGT
jgi:hypothetical protein